MYVIDTDILSLVQEGRSPDGERALSRIETVEVEVYVTIISFEEQVRGWLGYIGHARTPKREVVGYSRLHELIDDYHLRQILEYTDESAARFQALRRKYRRIGTLDLKIAAIVLQHDATLVTRNRRDFGQIAELRIEDWTLPE